MEKKDFFVSYNKEDKNWAKWVGGTLEEHGYTVYLQAWDIAPGDDFIARMNEFLKSSKGYIAIWSKAFSNSPYCQKELSTAFNEQLTGNLRLFLPVRVEDVPIDPLYKTTVYVDLFDQDEEQAKKILLNAVGHTANPRKKGSFPRRAAGADARQEALSQKPQYPGLLLSAELDTAPEAGSPAVRDIVILESSRAEKGDLFNRLVYDVFHALGFGHPTYNLQKTGREIDMVLRHRTERRVALVESKAKKEKIGGADINKFVGVLDVERDRYESEGSSVVGYYVSRSGFTATAIAQEEERSRAKGGRSEVILLGPAEITRELIQGKVICSLEQAADAVFRTEKDQLSLCESADLLVTALGWIWVLYYSERPRQTATHFALVHADGRQLLNPVAETLLEQAKAAEAAFADLTYRRAAPDVTQHKLMAKRKYFQYLETELGEVQFEGMPTDKEAGSVKVKLESIFVPLRFHAKQDHKDLEELSITINKILSVSQRCAILAKPGGGKSTLIRRIALAYAFPARRKKVKDQLPERSWFPVYIRCRDLGGDAMRSISEIIASIVQRAEIAQYKDAFQALIEDNLQAGQVLLLIDGLDEISQEQHRICFVNQLRTFIATYPQVHLLITSRETGFRAVAGTLTSYCDSYSIANLDEDQICTLSLNWHRAILDNPTQAEAESDKVCGVILKDPRIVALAENPLLLTTLLFVKRWVGYLPTKKCQLYEEMIKLLLVTWNAAAHDRLELDETEPQLAFVAYYMTVRGQQKITKDQLEKCIREARRAMPELLSYMTITPSKFVDQVEERSSLLIQQGMEENERGQLVASYEFSHLSFQEYLTAKAVVESWTSDDFANQDVVALLEQHIAETQWLEVIPLAAVLLGRQAKPLIEYLLQESEAEASETDIENGKENIAALQLANCVASEVPMSQETLERSIQRVVRKKRDIERIQRSSAVASVDVFNTILNSKYHARYREIVERELFSNLDSRYVYEFASAWLKICLNDKGDPKLTEAFRLLNSGKREETVTGALLMMQGAFHFTGSWDAFLEGAAEEERGQLWSGVFSRLLEMLRGDDILGIFAAAWSIAWSGYEEADIIPHELVPDFADRLTTLWCTMDAPYHVRRVLSWGLHSVCIPGLTLPDSPAVRSAVLRYFENPENEFDSYTAVYLGILTKQWSREETQERINRIEEHPYSRRNRFLRDLGYTKRKKPLRRTGTRKAPAAK